VPGFRGEAIVLVLRDIELRASQGSGLELIDEREAQVDRGGAERTHGVGLHGRIEDTEPDALPVARPEQRRLRGERAAQRPNGEPEPNHARAVEPAE